MHRMLRAARGGLRRPGAARPATRAFALAPRRPIRKLMAANRGEIAIRIFRAATELDIRTVAIYSKEDMKSMHRYKADEAYLVGKEASPVGAYLGYEEIVDVALANGVDAIHPGYGFLSENVHFARLCEANGIAFVGPESSVLNKFGDKTLARQLAVDTGAAVPARRRVQHAEEVRAFVEGGDDPVGYPVIVKAAHGGGGRGMRVVRDASELEENLAAEILSDGESTVHLYDRDCSVQRRFQKVVEIAPSVGLPDDLRAALLADAVRLTSAAGYRCAGTVEFLVDPATWKHYFIEVNPRIQVEHTVTEVVTGVDLVQSQIMVTAGKTLAEIGLADQDDAGPGLRDPEPRDHGRPRGRLPPDVGRLQVTGSALTYEGAIVKLSRALRETRIRGVKTNIGFMLNVLKHPDFRAGAATTSFIGDNPELFQFKAGGDRASKLLEYLAELAVNGGGVGAAGPPRYAQVLPPAVPLKPRIGLKQVLEAEGPEGFARAVRQHKGLLLTDTTMRDAHQSLRARTKDLVAAAPYAALHNCYSLETWGGATFDVALRFLHECLRGANGVGYTSYPDNAVFKFCDVAVKSGMDVFRVFDSLNYVENLRLGIDAVGAAGGVVEAAISYSGDVTDPDSKYNLDYYLNLATELKAKGIHVLAIKDMAGLLTPAPRRRFALRLEFPDLPIHVHTHDTAGTGVAAMLAAAKNGADAVDVAVKAAYADANELLGDIVKVTPSSKTCGDLAQFMVTNGLTKADVRDRSESLNFPSSVVEFFQGALGIPYGGFPEPLRTHVLAGAGKTDETFAGRPGAQLPAVDLEKVRELEEKRAAVDDRQLMSAVMYPQVFDDFMATTREFGDLSNLPTRAFVEPLDVGEELELSFARA
ncbi:pyruvate carboxylase [Aureococcus anophagefferens]|nr:pyruvate carboxylase [Aureococcus anophagefferens]